MKLGAIFPQTEVSPNVEDIRLFMTEVEAMGYDFVTAYDHVLGVTPERDELWQGPYTHDDPFHEIFSLLTYAAAITNKLEFATSVLILPQRQTALVAKQAAQLDLYSKGRLRLGVGVGWNQTAFQGMEADFTIRGRRIAEQVQVLKLLWQNEIVHYQGYFHNLDGVGINPLPIQRPIPVWFGGRADIVMRRMAKLGDGWMPGAIDFKEASDSLKKLHHYLEVENRNLDDFGLDVFYPLSRVEEQEYTADFKRWQEIGTTHLSVITMRCGFKSVSEHLTALENFIKLVK